MTKKRLIEEVENNNSNSELVQFNKPYNITRQISDYGPTRFRTSFFETANIVMLFFLGIYMGDGLHIQKKEMGFGFRSTSSLMLYNLLINVGITNFKFRFVLFFIYFLYCFAFHLLPFLI